MKPQESEIPATAMGGLADEALVERLKTGDREGYRELLERYRSPVMSYLFRMVGDREWAEDLAQETFLRVFRSVSGFKSQSKFSTWLYRIAHNLAVDFLKRRRLEPRLALGREDGDDPHPEPAATDTPGLAAQRREMKSRVVGAVKELGPKFRDVFVLCAMQDLSYEEAGEILDLSPKTVSSRLCRARKKFRSLMASYVGAR